MRGLGFSFLIFGVISQAPPAKPEACELEPLKAAIVIR